MPDLELEKIRKRYENRRNTGAETGYTRFSAYQHHRISEIEYWFSQQIAAHFGAIESLNVLDVGAGSGYAIGYFRRLGLRPSQLWAAELLSPRVEELKRWLADDHIFQGDASDLKFPTNFDIILQSTVFSTILDPRQRQRLAQNMWRALKPGGMILWHDLFRNAQGHPDVRPVDWKQILELFPEAKKNWRHKVTLMPPIGRRVGRFYSLFNLPFLRTHFVATLTKES